MKPVKILRIIALLVAVVAAFVGIPYVALALIVLGFVIGIMGVEEDRRMLYLVMAVALSMMTGALAAVPVAGEYLTSILSNVSLAINAGAIAVILTMIYERVME